MKIVITILIVAAIAIFLRKMNPKKKSIKREKTVWHPQSAPPPIPTPTAAPIPTPKPKPEELLMEEPKKKNNRKTNK